jgi:glutaredoxin/glutathione-dependent peroxiredoxin
MIKVGQTLPNATFKVRENDAFVDKTTNDIFANKKVVLFAVPGAFTPTCSDNHLPSYVEHHDAILAKAVDSIAVVAVNDHFVMKAWAQHTNSVDKIIFLSDGNGDFTKQLGLELDASGFGMGIRSKRYAMIIDNGVVKTLNIEEGHGIEMSGAEAILKLL